METSSLTNVQIRDRINELEAEMSRGTAMEQMDELEAEHKALEAERQRRFREVREQLGIRPS